MMKRLGLLVAALFAAMPAEAQSPPFNAYSIATLGGNCSTAAAIPYQTAASSTACTPGGVDGQAMTLVGGVPQWTSLAGAGSVTSVALSMPSIFSVTGSPITASGTLTATLASQAQNLFFASPDGSAGAPSFRAMVAADVPALDATKITTGTLPIARGGTGSTTATGTGQTVLATSPTLASPTTTGTLTGTAANFSGAVSAGALTASSLTLPSQTANTVFAAPDGSNGVPAFRALSGDDVAYNPNTTGSNGRTLQNLYGDGDINIKSFGFAVGNTGAQNVTAFNNALTYALANKRNIYIPSGTYPMCAIDINLDSVNGYFKLSGAGRSQTVLDFTACVTTGTAFYMHANDDWYYTTIADFSILANHAGNAGKIGRDDFADPANVFTCLNVGFYNINTSGSNVGLELNYVVNSNFIGCQANGYANGTGTNYGTALQIDQVEFTTFTNGSYGNASFGIRFMNGISFSLTFLNVDIENCNICINNSAATSGKHLFSGGQISLWQNFAVQSISSIGGDSFTFDRVNFTAANWLDTANLVGVVRRDREYGQNVRSYTSGVAQVNDTGYDVDAVIYGTNSSIVIDGFTYGATVGTFKLYAGSSITLTGTGTMVWTGQR